MEGRGNSGGGGDRLQSGPKHTARPCSGRSLGVQLREPLTAVGGRSEEYMGCDPAPRSARGKLGRSGPLFTPVFSSVKWKWNPGFPTLVMV